MSTRMRLLNHSKFPSSHLVEIIAVAILLIAASCKDAGFQGSAKPSDTYTVPPYSSTTPLVKIFINDDTDRTVYVNEEFDIKVVLYDMPKLLVSTSITFVLPSSIELDQFLNDPSPAGYFAPRESTETTSQLWFDETSDSILCHKTYINGTTPNVASDGVLFKIRCISHAATTFLSITPVNVVFFRMTAPGVLQNGTEKVQFTPLLQPAVLHVKNDLFLP